MGWEEAEQLYSLPHCWKRGKRSTGIRQLNVFAVCGAALSSTPAAIAEHRARTQRGQDRHRRLAADGISQTSHSQEALLTAHLQMCTRLSRRQAEAKAGQSLAFSPGAQHAQRLQPPSQIGPNIF